MHSPRKTGTAREKKWMRWWSCWFIPSIRKRNTKQNNIRLLISVTFILFGKLLPRITGSDGWNTFYYQDVFSTGIELQLKGGKSPMLFVNCKRSWTRKTQCFTNRWKTHFLSPWIPHIPDPELLIRTSGEHRISNFPAPGKLRVFGIVFHR